MVEVLPIAALIVLFCYAVSRNLVAILMRWAIKPFRDL
jgi:hypothetical protein